MFHVERRFSEEIVRGWELFHVEHFGVTWVHYRRPCSTWNHPVSHVLPFLQNGRPINLVVRCAPQCSTWNGLPQTRGESAKFGLPGKTVCQSSSYGGWGSVFCRNYRKSYLERKQVGCHVPRGTKSQNRSRANAGGKSLVLSSRWGDDRGILCAHEEEPPK